jgi:membrane protease YdiL (CAAX protease family)
MDRFLGWIKAAAASDRKVRWWLQLLLYVPLLAVGVVVLVGPPAWLLYQLGILPRPGEAVDDWVSALGLALIEAILFAAVLWLTHLAQRRLRATSLGGLGLELGRRWPFQFGTGVGLGAFAVGLSVGLAWMLGWYRPLGFAWQSRAPDELGPALVFSLFANLQPGLLEEVVFRGYLLQSLESRWGPRVAVLASSALFAILHVNYEPPWVAALSALLIALLLAQTYLMRRSLWLPIGFHFAWDWCYDLLGAGGRSGERAVLLVSQVTDSPCSWTSGVAGILAAALLVLLWRLVGRRQALAKEDTPPPRDV